MSASLTKYTMVLFGGVTAATVLAGQAAAQQEPSGPVAQLQEVVVTAEKRTENILSVPMSVTAVDPGTLLQQNLVSIQDYATTIPGVAVDGTKATDISMQGINSGVATSPTVAITIDDVPIGSTSWAGNTNLLDLDPADIKQLEVLRGPQGTLYGASSLGGLLKYVMTDPSLSRFSGHAEATYSSVEGGANGYAVRGGVNLPIVNDMLAVRLSAFHRMDPSLGDQYSATTSQRIAKASGQQRVDGFRGAVLFQPLSNLKINVSHLEQTTRTANGGSTLLTSPTDFAPLYGYFANTNTFSVGRTLFELTEARGTFDAGFATITAISGWQVTHQYLNSDVTSGFGFVFDGLAFAGLPPIYPNEPANAEVLLDDGSSTRKFTQEVRIASSSSGPFQWLVGGFYDSENSQILQNLTANLASGALIGGVVEFPLPSTYKERAVFGNVTYHFTSQFDVQAGLRYSKNDQTYTANQVVPPLPSAEEYFGTSLQGTPAASSDHSLTWQVAPRFRITPNLMVYARAASGYRPGGPNTAAAPQPTFGPDKVIDYELGTKGLALDDKLTFDVSVFDINWTNIQLAAITVAQQSYFTNGGTARSRGLETELQFRPGAGWKLTANLTLLDAKLTEDLPAATGLVARSGDELPDDARFSANLGLEKSWLVLNGYTALVGGRLTHVGSRHMDYGETVAPVSLQPPLIAPAYHVGDLYASLENDGWNVSVFLRNVGNERGIEEVSDGQGVGSTTSALFIMPRTVGVNLSYRF